MVVDNVRLLKCDLYNTWMLLFFFLHLLFSGSHIFGCHLSIASHNALRWVGRVQTSIKIRSIRREQKRVSAIYGLTWLCLESINVADQSAICYWTSKRFLKPIIRQLYKSENIKYSGVRMSEWIFPGRDRRSTHFCLFFPLCIEWAPTASTFGWAHTRRSSSSDSMVNQIDCAFFTCALHFPFIWHAPAAGSPRTSIDCKNGIPIFRLCCITIK